MQAAAAPASASAKVVARQGARKVLKAISADYVSSQSRAVCDRVIGHPALARSDGVSVYLPMTNGRELDTWPLIEALFSTSAKRVYVPKVDGDGSMRMLRASSLDELRALPINAWHVPEHTDDAAQGLADGTTNGDIDLVIVPAMLFAPSTLTRLGRGKGFYDRFLVALDAARAERGLPPSVKLGVGFDVQMVESVPAEAHDIRMDAVVSASAEYPAV